MEEVILEGVFSYIVFQGDNGYTIAQFDTKDDSHTCVGYLNEVTLDAPYKITGHFVNHVKYGKQIYIDLLEKIIPSDEKSIINFLASSTFKGIGFNTAKKIVDRLGEDAIEKLKTDIEIVDDLTFLSTVQKESLKKGILEEFDETILFLTKYGFNANQIEKIKTTYQDNVKNIITHNPYQLVFDIDGIGFKTADKVAKLFEEEVNPNYRLQALIYSECISQCVSNGSTYIDIEEFIAYIAKKENISKQLVETQIDYLLQIKSLYLDNKTCLYHDTQYSAETGIAHFLNDFMDRPIKTTTRDIDGLIAELEDETFIQYSKQQKQAIKEIFTNNALIVTGGPGTGKTTILKAIVQVYEKLYPEQQIALCAPTGRASKRISEICDCPATTIHSLLKWNLETNEFKVNQDNPIEYDFLIIDEFSMVDNFLFYNLCLAAKNVKRILFVGDEHQLPSVSCGNLLKDMIESELIPIVKLTQIYRQKDGNGIVDLADKIVKGKHIGMVDDVNAKMFEMCDEYILSQIVGIYEDALNKGYEDSEVQVLSPIYKGSCGIDAINEAIQQAINPADDNKAEIKIGNKIFREGDKVLQLKNQSDDFVFNGDIGKIVEIDEFDNELLVDFDGNAVLYTKDDFDHLTLAYCISIHKSQGSEYKIVIMPIARQHSFMLYRKLIYTGITRAKNSLVLLGNSDVLNQAILTKEKIERKTLLKQRLHHLY